MLMASWNSCIFKKMVYFVGFCIFQTNKCILLQNQIYHSIALDMGFLLVTFIRRMENGIGRYGLFSVLKYPKIN